MTAVPCRGVVLLLLVVALLWVGVVGQEEDRIVGGLPGQPSGGAPFAQYGGFVGVSPTRHLYYYMVESQRDPERDPLVLWLNGGPGCSSLGGLFGENGPWRPQADGTLQWNPYSWNRIANMIFLEEPAGVGFSNFTSPADRVTNDAQTADDAYQFLLGWFQRFRAFQGRPFYITGESYAGHYVPDLSQRIVQGNKNASQDQIINFKGFMIGNACFWGPVDSYHTIDAWYDHGLISPAVFSSLKTECKNMDSEANPSPACAAVQSVAEKQIGDINHYNIYEDVCFQSQENQASRLMESMGRAGFWTHQVMHRQTKASMDRAMKSRSSVENPAPPCIDTFVHNYLNRADVQTAIHADRLTHQGILWNQCQVGVIEYQLVQDHRRSMLPVYDFLRSEDPSLRILVYSGDIDTVVSTESTRASLSYMNLQVLHDWTPWEVDGQVAGRRVVYDRLSFSTVRYAGHMVPGSQPVRAFTLFEDYLDNRDPVDHKSPWWQEKQDQEFVAEASPRLRVNA